LEIEEREKQPPTPLPPSLGEEEGEERLAAEGTAAAEAEAAADPGLESGPELEEEATKRRRD